jgi:transposase InsO family protein
MKWLTDITAPASGWKSLLLPVIDCFDGQVVSWSVRTRPDATLVNTMLDDALDASTNMINRYSDRGGHTRRAGSSVSTPPDL